MAISLSYCIVDFSNQVFDPDNIQTCDSCGEPTKQQAVRVNNRYYHSECMCCRSCGVILPQDSVFQLDDNHFYCPLCIDTAVNGGNTNCSTCNECKEEILKSEVYLKLLVKKKGNGKEEDETEVGEGATESMSVVLHESCLKCFNCEHLIDYTGLFYDHDGHFYCKPCYIEAFTTPCFACKQPISECAVRTSGGGVNEAGQELKEKGEGRVYHPNCLKCSEKSCGRRLTNMFQTHSTTGLPYCIECYYFYFAKKCSKCSAAINIEPESGRGTYISFNKKFFHSSCFRCEQPRCTAVIDNTLFSLVDKKVTCQSCAKNFIVALQTQVALGAQAKI
ncbi:four and a half LIM domains protein 2-like isoform X1 [Convolutriloba macropyga]|uniref:four and a half LIM domains protein 2-like isoform X1 n=1 Tax=Convolutriloba macropyga TaxID=536237 RepID=UPI003F5262C3